MCMFVYIEIEILYVIAKKVDTYNVNGSGCQLELHSIPTSTPQGSKQVHSVVQSVPSTTSIATQF